MLVLRYIRIYIILGLLSIACRKERLVMLQRIKPQQGVVANLTPTNYAILSLSSESPFQTPPRNGCTPCLERGKKYKITVQTTHDPISSLDVDFRKNEDENNKQTTKYVWNSVNVGSPIENLHGTFNENKTKWETPLLEFTAIGVVMHSFHTVSTSSYRNDAKIELTDEDGRVVYHSTSNLMFNPPNWVEGNTKDGLYLTVIGSICKANEQTPPCPTRGHYPETGRYKIRAKAENGGTIQRLFLFTKNKNGDAKYQSFNVFQKTEFETPEFAINDQILEFSLTAGGNNGNISVEVIKDGREIRSESGSSDVFIRFSDQVSQVDTRVNGTGQWPASGFWKTYNP